MHTYIQQHDSYLDVRIGYEASESHVKSRLNLFEKVFTYQHKSLVPVMATRQDGTSYPTGKRKSVKSPVHVFNRTDHEWGSRYILNQGFLYRALRTLEILRPKVQVQVEDKREPFPEPLPVLNLSFRYGQQEIYETLIEVDRSGSIVLPTRYGKSYLILALLRTFNVPTLLLMPGLDLIDQQYEFLCGWFPHGSIGRISGTHRKLGERITIGSLDSIGKLADHELDQFRLAICDEMHASVSPERAPELARIKRARLYGFTATDSGRFDNADLLMEGIYGPPIVRKSFSKAVEEGAICPIVVYMLKIPMKFSGPCITRVQAYRRHHYFYKRLAITIVHILEKIIPADWQTLAFIDTGAQGDYLMKLLPSHYVMAMAGRFKGKKARQEVADKMASGEIKRCLATSIYSQGVTFSDLRCMVNLSGGGGSITSVQRPGRLAEKREGKACGYMIDFLFEMEEDPRIKTVPSKNQEWRCLTNDSYARMAVYEKLGYTLKVVDRSADIKLETGT
jgi:superfamily II DNA or RNA helicase